MNQKAREIYNYLIDRYGANSNNVGFLAFGSASRGQDDENSDIDFYVLTQDEPEHHRDNFVYKGKRIDVIFNSLACAKDYLNSEKNRIRRPTVFMIVNSKIIYDKLGKLKLLKSIAKSNLKTKVKVTKTEILMHKYSLDDFLGEAERDLKNKNEIAFVLDSQLIIDNTLEIFCKLKNILLVQPKEMKNNIAKKDKKFARLFINYSKAGNKDKLKILKQLVNRVYELSGGGLPKNWYID